MTTNYSYDLVLFDLDGTLIETAPDLSKTVNHILKTILDLPPLPESQNRLFIGGGFKLMFERALEHYGVSNDKLQLVIDKARNYFPQVNGREAYVYENVIEALQYLKMRNIKIGVLTNKIDLFSQPILKMKGISEYLDLTVSGDTCSTNKPNPAVLQHCCNLVSVSPERVIMVGDSIYDVQVAKNSGALAVCVDYGYSETPVHELNADIVISSIYDFVQKQFA